MFTTMLAHAKLLALASIIGGGAAYTAHAVTTRPEPQNQQWQQRDQGPQNFQDEGRQPPERQDVNRRLDRHIDHQVDRHLNNLLNCQPRQDFHHGGHFDRR